MFQCLRHFVSPIAAMVVILALGAATPARANLQIQLNGTTVGSDVSGGTAIYGAPPTTFAGFLVSVLSTSSNSTGSPTFATLSGADLLITNTSGATASLLITLGDTDFVAPQFPPNITLTSSVGGTVSVPDASNTLVYQSFVNNDNSQNGVTGPWTTVGAPQMPNITGGSFNNTQTGTITATLGSGSPLKYSITESFLLTLSNGSTFNFSSSTTLRSLNVQSVPEPSTMVLAGLGTLGLIGYGLRRRKALGA